MTAIDDLTRLCPPPADVPQADWPAIETTLGMRLPHDYKQLADTYGPGAFCDFIRIYHPRAATAWVDLHGPTPPDLRRQLQQDQQRGIHPATHDPRDLFAIGVTDNGNHLFWITTPNSEPDVWRITVNEARGPGRYTFDGTLTQFRVSVMGNQTQVPLFPRGLLDDGITFTPATPTPRRAEPRPAGESIDVQAVRAWARDNGYNLPDRGRIPIEIIQAWKGAHPS
ncbi:Lsr2 family protein [Streptomyces sp. HNM0663]|uniref:Lsr2 family protein n=1 Tax=Streptomyces chengmaiensis TaxID=3040919 RepID=A0ABT6HZS7_9ACTN|nr:histone-like nucleoid-structuring protein Lsr2 [Streptomyces chengmaiensis]MDH2393871.1 Lsr2 family protein [Streptomyces chengmaiensis]